jgi:hypothetical protein
MADNEGPLMAVHKSPHKVNRRVSGAGVEPSDCAMSPAAPAVRQQPAQPQQVSTPSKCSTPAQSKAGEGSSSSGGVGGGGGGAATLDGEFFSPYKPPVSYRRGPGDDPAAKRRPKSCMLRHVSSPRTDAPFARNEPTDALHTLRLKSRLERGMNHVSPATLSALLNGSHDQHYDRIIVIDARFDYEYAGGHIRGAHSMLVCVCGCVFLYRK